MKEMVSLINDSLKVAEKEIKEKRVLSGMQLFDLQKNYVVMSKKDYTELLEKLENLKA